MVVLLLLIIIRRIIRIFVVGVVLCATPCLGSFPFCFFICLFSLAVVFFTVRRDLSSSKSKFSSLHHFDFIWYFFFALPSSLCSFFCFFFGILHNIVSSFEHLVCLECVSVCRLRNGFWTNDELKYTNKHWKEEAKVLPSSFSGSIERRL